MSLPKDGLQGNPQAVLDEIDKFSSKRGGMIEFKPPKIAVSRTALQKIRPAPKILIEMGTYVGASAVAWGSILKDLNGGSPDGVKVYCLELDEVFARNARELLALAGVDDVVQVIQGAASDSLRKLKADGTVDKTDVLFMDHMWTNYLPDLKVAEELGLFHKGSVILTDNVDDPEMEYVKYIRAGGSGEKGSIRYESENIVAGPGRRPGTVQSVEVTTIVDVGA